MIKHALVRQLSDELRREIDVAQKVALSSREAATHEEARPENDKDTRAVEAAYLAGAQAERVRDLERLRSALAFLELRTFGPDTPISASALVEVEVEGRRAHYFLAPQGGGLRSVVDGIAIQVITPQSPVGRALLGKMEGDVIEVRTDGGLREYEIVGVK